MFPDSVRAPAEKPPEPSRRTIALAVFALTAFDTTVELGRPVTSPEREFALIVNVWPEGVMVMFCPARTRSPIRLLSVVTAFTAVGIGVAPPAKRKLIR